MSAYIYLFLMKLTLGEFSMNKDCEVTRLKANLNHVMRKENERQSLATSQQVQQNSSYSASCWMVKTEFE